MTTISAKVMIETHGNSAALRADRATQDISDRRAERTAQGMTETGRLAWRRYAGGLSSAHYAARQTRAVKLLRTIKAGL